MKNEIVCPCCKHSHTPAWTEYTLADSYYTKGVNKGKKKPKQTRKSKYHLSKGDPFEEIFIEGSSCCCRSSYCNCSGWKDHLLLCCPTCGVVFKQR